MERLNNIIGRSAQRRPHPSDSRSIYGNAQQGQRPSQGQAVPPTQPPTVRRPLPEQMARLGQQHPYGNQPSSAPRARTMQGTQRQREFPTGDTHEPRPQERRGYGAVPGSRPPQSSYPRSRPITNTGSTYTHPQRARLKQDEQSLQPVPLPPARPVNEYYHPDTYHPPLPADVLEEGEDWEIEEEEQADMRYGDWEEDEAEVLVYQRADVGMLSGPKTHAARSSREFSPALENETRTTRNLRDVRMPASIPHTRTQEIQRYNRITQPLDPQLVADMNRERSSAQEQQSIQRPMRQIAPGGQPTRSLERYVLPETAAPTTIAKAVCPKCKGAGFLRLNVPFGHPNFGKPIACACKEAERKEKRRQQLREMSNLDAFHDKIFRTFNARVPGVQEAFNVSFEYAQEPRGWLLMIGPNGCGKTHLAAAIANQSLDRGSVVLFAVVPDLLDHLRAAFAPNAAEVYDQLFAKMREAEVLVLDDLGAQQSSPWANEKLFQLLNYRYNMGMPTVITANPKGIQGIDERIRSRLTDISLVEKVILDRARDYRPNHPRRD